MATLRILLVLAAALAPHPAAADPVDDWRPYMIEASQRFGVPMGWIASVIRVESGGRATLGGAPVVSRAGAMGLMQLMPATWAAMRDDLALSSNPFDPHDNILAGTFYLRLMYDRFGYPGCLAAYNAGPRRYARYLAGERSLPAETVRYVALASAPAVVPRTAPEGLFTIEKTAPAASSKPLFAIAPRF